MRQKIKAWIRDETRVDWRRVTGMIAIVLISALVSAPLLDLLDTVGHAQQQTVNTAVVNPAPSLLTTTNTNLTTAVIALASAQGGTSGSGFVTGTHNIYGWQLSGATPCYVQVFDRYPASAITVGTTVPVTSLVVTSSSAIQSWTVFPFSAFSITSALGLAATTTQGGATVCSTTPIVQFLYK